MKLDALITLCQTRTETLLTQSLKNKTASAPHLQEAMAYAVLNGGKRIRPLLIYITGYTFNVPWENLDAAACAIELIHSYSLIHDDLPAMDNADLRRGKASCHKVFGEAIAILAGDALQPLAFEMIATHPCALTAEQRLKMISILSHACGSEGIAGGQTLDILGVNSLDALIQMQQLKTSTLLTACTKLGMASANIQDKHTHHALQKYAESIGLVFQIQDDLLDVESDITSIGKPPGLDAQNHKTTFPSLLGIEKTRQKIQELFTTALTAIEFLDEKASLLREFANYLLHRKK